MDNTHIKNYSHYRTKYNEYYTPKDEVEYIFEQVKISKSNSQMERKIFEEVK